MTTSIMAKRSHPDLNAFKAEGGMLNVVNPPDEMLLNIGREIKFKPCSSRGTIHYSERWFVTGVQRIYNGDLAYRVSYVGDTFGCAASIGSFDWVE